MGEKTAIHWTQKTHNFWYGCKKVSQGCKFCYAERDMKGYGRDFNTVTRAKGFDKPLTWKEPSMIFTCSWSDFFIAEADKWRSEAWQIIKDTSHTWQILTKRPERIKDCLPADWGEGYPNVWLGVSVESPDNTHRIGELAKIPAALRFISAEPLLEPFVLSEYVVGWRWIHWLIVGGESGPYARKLNIQGAHALIMSAQNMGIPVFFKQVGGNTKIGDVWGGDELFGRRYQEIPLPYVAPYQTSMFEDDNA